MLITVDGTNTVVNMAEQPAKYTAVSGFSITPLELESNYLLTYRPCRAEI